MRRFAADDVARLARVLMVERGAGTNAVERSANKPSERPAREELTEGELAAEVFARLEQRHSLAEIVIALAVPPHVVRALFHDWLMGLWTGELHLQKVPALPAVRGGADHRRRVTPGELQEMLRALPLGEPIRISVARDAGDFHLEDGTEYRNLIELGGFVMTQPIGVDEIYDRVGAGTYRITASTFDPPAVRWEVYATLDRSACRPAQRDCERGDEPHRVEAELERDSLKTASGLSSRTPARAGSS